MGRVLVFIEEAPHLVAGVGFVERRNGRVADVRNHIRAAVREGALGRQVEGDGHRALDGVQPLPHLAAHARDRFQEQARVGMQGLLEQGTHVRLFHDHAQVHDHHFVGDVRDHGQVVGDVEHRHADLGLHLLHQVQDLGLHRHVQGRRGLVGDQERRVAGQGHGDHGPLPHAAGQLVGVLVEALRGVGDSDLAQHVDRDLAGLLPVRRAVQQDHLANLVANRVHRRQAGHRLLEDHGDLASPDGPDGRAVRRQFQQFDRLALGGVEGDRAVHGAARGRHDAQDGLCRHALAASALPDHADRAVARDREGDAVERLQDPFAQEEVGFDVPEFQRDVAHEPPPCRFTCRGPRRRAGRRRGS